MSAAPVLQTRIVYLDRKMSATLVFTEAYSLPRSQDECNTSVYRGVEFT